MKNMKTIKNISLVLTLVMSALAMNIYAAEEIVNYNFAIENKLSDKILEVEVDSKHGNSETDLKIVLDGVDKDVMENVPINLPAIFTIKVYTKDREFKWSVARSNLVGGAVANSTMGSLEKEFENDRMDI